MKRLAGIFAAIAVVVLVAWSRTDSPPPAAAAKNGLRIEEAAQNPWSHLRLNNDPATFRFAIVTDRTGGARPGVFERAVEQLNWLQPEFVVSVGDLIQGGTTDRKQIDKNWRELNGFVARLEMPFFYLPGNHDISNKVMDQRWQELFGRRHYHFVYKDVLFLLLNTEEQPAKLASGRFRAEQLAYVQRALAENRRARWTLVFLHRPVWTYPSVAKTGWLEIERALAGRRYTVFAGHKHRYERFVRNGQRYYMLATTGGGSRLRGAPLGEFDHLVWVTMKRDGPVIANLMMEGIFPEDIRPGRAAP
jgi:serine/threonine-protein phosphatase CPPED1